MIDGGEWEGRDRQLGRRDRSAEMMMDWEGSKVEMEVRDWRERVAVGCFDGYCVKLNR